MAVTPPFVPGRQFKVNLKAAQKQLRGQLLQAEPPVNKEPTKCPPLILKHHV